MNKSICLTVLLIFTLVIDINSQWVLVGNGLGPTTYFSLAANTNTIFAGGNNGTLYFTTNYGANWATSYVFGQPVYSLAANGNNIFAGTDGQGVFFSSNNGTSWSPTSIYNQTVGALAINSNFVFAGASPNYGVYRSSNNGTNWIQTPLNNRSILSLAVKGDTIFAGTLTYGVYISTDNGTTWAQTSLNSRSVISFAVNGSNVFAGTSGTGVWISTDNGSNWTQSTLTGPSVNSLAVYGNNIFAGTYGAGFYASTDNGTSWAQRNEGLAGMFVRALCISNNYIFACPDSRVYRRPLNELTGFQPVSNEIPERFSLSQNFPNPFNPKTIIRFNIKDSRFTTLKVFDILGREAASLVNEELKPGTYEVDWNADKFSSGVYYYKLVAGDYTETKKMVLIK